MLAEEQLSNYWRSFIAYVETNYTTTGKYFVGENELDTTNLTEWVEFIWSSQTPHTFVRHADNAHPGNIMNATIGAIICVKPTSVVGRIVTIRDVVVNLLRRPLIEVLDWAGSKSVIGSLQGEGLVSDVNLGLDGDINRWSLKFQFRYQEMFERVR